MDEVCAGCKSPPGSHGCMKIGSDFGDGVIVKHSTSVFEPYQIEEEDEDGDEDGASLQSSPP